MYGARNESIDVTRSSELHLIRYEKKILRPQALSHSLETGVDLYLRVASDVDGAT